ncbi:MAG: MaoC family dehydratase [Vicinamibacterales bacterium]
MVDLDAPATLAEHVGHELGVSDWVTITQDQIDRFAEITGDPQWIHVDPERAARESPFGTTIAHGFLTLSYVSVLARKTMRFARTGVSLNYGLNKVRFVSPVPAGSRIRARFTPAAVETVPGGTQVTWHVVIEREGAAKPSCVVEWLMRYMDPRPAADQTA